MSGIQNPFERISFIVISYALMLNLLMIMGDYEIGNVMALRKDNRMLNRIRGYHSSLLRQLLLLAQALYKPLVQRQPASIRSVRKWSPEAVESLQGCFEATQWDVLCDPHNQDIDEVTSCVTDYINFCVDSVVPSKTIRCFANNKPWVTSNLKHLLNQKKRAFKTGDKEELKRVQPELRIRIKEAKEEYRTKLETKLENNNTHDVWRGLKDITGFNLSSSGAITDGNYERANELNQFFLRFDNDSPTTTLSSAGSPVVLNLNTSPEQQPPPFTAHTSSIPNIYTSSDSNGPFTTPAQDQSSSSAPTFTADQVKKELKKLKQGKAAGPDGIQPKTMQRSCAALACKQLKGSHTFSALAGALNDIHTEFNIREKTVRTTPDNGSNFLKAFRVYGETDENNNPEPVGEGDGEEDDGGHNDDCEEEEESIEGVEFVDAGALLDEDDYLEYQLPKHHRCACHLLNLVSTVDASKAEVNAFYKRVSRFTPVELAFLAVSPVAKALDVLQGETSVQMGWLVPTITLLRTKLQQLKVASRFCEPLIAALLSGLEKRFGKMLADPELIAAAILVPKFKTCWTSDENILKLGLDYILSHLDCQAENHISEGSQSSKEEDFFSSLKKALLK
ncbi:hypothetical protein NFI96_005520 [Prochilodus magdalenae]|nr:hypothetical protein NFI96_005520 [Prochilodus magdalenae]